MAKMKSQPAAVDTRPLGETHSWARSNGTHIAGRAYIDGADETAAQMEGKWGADCLRLLVSPELREKFDRQRYLFNQAIWHGGLEDVRRESGRMVKAWMALDRAAESAGREKLSPLVWEVALSDGSVAAIVPDTGYAKLVSAEGRRLAVYTLEEIGRLLVAYPDIAKAKIVFPGAEVFEVRRSIEDPMGAIWTRRKSWTIRSRTWAEPHDPARY
jgi:hypothetical protein